MSRAALIRCVVPVPLGDRVLEPFVIPLGREAVTQHATATGTGFGRRPRSAHRRAGRLISRQIRLGQVDGSTAQDLVLLLEHRDGCRPRLRPSSSRSTGSPRRSRSPSRSGSTVPGPCGQQPRHRRRTPGDRASACSNLSSEGESSQVRCQPNSGQTHLSHGRPCAACGHGMHTYVSCSDSCDCVPPTTPGEY